MPVHTVPNPSTTDTGRTIGAGRWLPLLAILLLALAVRAPALGDAAFRVDLIHFARWMNIIERDGLFEFYQPELRLGTWDRPYPPLPIYAFSLMSRLYGGAPDPATALDDPTFMMLLKLPPLAAELGLIAVVGVWLGQRRSRLRWLLPAALALSPGLGVTTAWWGQYDSVFTLFLLLALVALNRDRPLAAWAWFAIALLIKQPAAALGPLLLVVSFRRYGWRTTAAGMALSVGLYALFTIPFALGSGLENALSPYLKASDAFPYLTNNAYNVWYAVASLIKGGPVGFAEAQFRDSLPLAGGLSGGTIGFALFSSYVLLVCVVCWRQAHERREFVWAAALLAGFFVLPTQVHERYLYPAVVFAVVAIAQDRRLMWVAAGLTLTFSYNVLAIATATRWPGTDIGQEELATPVAFANVALLVALTYVLLRRPPPVVTDEHPSRITSISTEVPRSQVRDRVKSLFSSPDQPIPPPFEPAYSVRLRTLASYVAFALLAVSIVALHTVHFQGRVYRQDEAWIVHGAVERGGAAAMTQWVSTNIHPPLWVIVGNAWVDTVGQHETVARTLSGLLTLLTLALLYRLGADLAGSPRSLVPIVAVVIVGSSTHFQFYMHEFRPYPGLVLCAVATCLTFLRWLRRPSFRRALLFVVAGIAALYVHFFSVYVLAALALYFVFFVRWRSGLALRAAGLFVAIGLSYLGWILPFVYAITVTNPGGIEYAMETSIPSVLSAYRRLSFVPRELFGVLFITAILIPVRRIISPEARVTPGDERVFGRDISWRKGFPLFVGLMVFVLAFVVNVFVANLTLRSLTLLLPLAALVAAMGFVSLPRAAQLAMLLFIVPTAFTFTNNEPPGPQGEIGAFVAESYRPGSPLIVNLSYVPRQISVLYYLQQRMGEPVPHDIIWQVINPRQPYTDFLPYDPVHVINTSTWEGFDDLWVWLEEKQPEYLWYIERHNDTFSMSTLFYERLGEHYNQVQERHWENEYTVIELHRR